MKRSCYMPIVKGDETAEDALPLSLVTSPCSAFELIARRRKYPPPLMNDSDDDSEPGPLDLTAKVSSKRPRLEDEGEQDTSTATDGPLDLRLVEKMSNSPSQSNNVAVDFSASSASSLSSSFNNNNNFTLGDFDEDDDDQETSQQDLFIDDFGEDDDDDEETGDEGMLMGDSLLETGSNNQQQNKTAGFYRCGGAGQGSNSCPSSNGGEHWHCKLCPMATFARKEDIERHERRHLRHQLWLARGFLRCTPSDRSNCLHAFPKCPYTHQTHYHCLQPGCARCYVNTYEVQLHAVSHRKETAIALDGFQRFRATDMCGIMTCPYLHAHTTHFHCQRQGCGYSFKVKADMEKHKIYHQRDDDYVREGFRKFMKYQACPFATQGCTLSRAANHIHCLRCGYVLHSSGQLNSHRRKHDREDSERGNNKQQNQTPSIVAPPNLLSSANTTLRSAFQPVIDSVVNSITLLINNNNRGQQPTAAVENEEKAAIKRAPPGAVTVKSEDENPTTPEKSSAKLKINEALIQPTVSQPGEPCCQRACIYSERGVVHYHCPLGESVCPCSFTRLATLKLHLKAVHNS